MSVKVKDVVYLVGIDGPAMLVTSIGPTADTAAGFVQCVWFNDIGEVQVSNFDPNLLETEAEVEKRERDDLLVYPFANILFNRKSN